MKKRHDMLGKLVYSFDKYTKSELLWVSLILRDSLSCKKVYSRKEGKSPKSHVLISHWKALNPSVFGIGGLFACIVPIA